MKGRHRDRRIAFRWIAAVAISAALVAAAPFVGDIQRWLRGMLGGAYVPVVNAGVGALTALALAAAFVRIRNRRPLSYTLLAAAVLVAAAYAWSTGLASAESNAVERFHFVEYGVITWLFYRAPVRAAAAPTAPQPVGRGYLAASPVACALAVAACDEWLQHLAPGRIGEVRDIAMNVAAIVAGLLVSAAIAPPRRMMDASAARVAFATAGAICAIAIAAFVTVVHTGTLVADAEVAFLSRYDAAALAARAAGAAPRGPLAGLIEDQYVTEAVWHVQARNARWEAGDFAAAWGENRILEKYYAPVLRSGHGWPPEQRADAERRLRVAAVTGPFRSRAERLPIWQFR